MQPVDRLPFWPKLNGSYAPAQDTPFCDMTVDALHDCVGSDRHVGVGAITRDVRKTTSVEVTEEDGARRTVYESPYGRTEGVAGYDAGSHSWHPLTYPVRTLQDIAVLKACYEDLEVELDPGLLEDTRGRVADLDGEVLTVGGMGTSALMMWVQHLAGIENAHYFLIEHPAEVCELFDAMHRVMLRRAEIVCEHAPWDLTYITENTSTTLTSPDQYRTYCHPHLQEYTAIAAQAGRLVALHMCGHLKLLLPDLATLPVAAFEAFTTPTLGATTLLDGRTACPDTCLIGGTNAMTWLQTPEAIITELDAGLAPLPHHRGLVLTSAGVMPPLCSPDTIRAVCQWVRDYPARM